MASWFWLKCVLYDVEVISGIECCIHQYPFKFTLAVQTSISSHPSYWCSIRMAAAYPKYNEQ